MLLSHFFPASFLFLAFSPFHLSRKLYFSRVWSSTCRILSTIASRYAGFSRVKKKLVSHRGDKSKSTTHTGLCMFEKSGVVFFFIAAPVLSLTVQTFFSVIYICLFSALSFRIILININYMHFMYMYKGRKNNGTCYRKISS